jgi:hypothetical protein
VKKQIGLIVLTLICISQLSFSQTKNGTKAYYPKNYLIYVTDSVLSVSGIKLLDSLVKLKNDSAIIIYHSGGDIDQFETYYRFCKTGNSWAYQSKNGLSTGVLGLPLRPKEDQKYPSAKNIFFQDAAHHSSSVDHYYYLFIVNNRIIKSIMSNSEISVIAELDPALNDDVEFFEKFDEYSRKLKP